MQHLGSNATNENQLQKDPIKICVTSLNSETPFVLLSLLFLLLKLPTFSNKTRYQLLPSHPIKPTDTNPHRKGNISTPWATRSPYKWINSAHWGTFIIKAAITEHCVTIRWAAPPLLPGGGPKAPGHPDWLHRPCLGHPALTLLVGICLSGSGPQHLGATGYLFDPCNRLIIGQVADGRRRHDKLIYVPKVFRTSKILSSTSSSSSLLHWICPYLRYTTELGVRHFLKRGLRLRRVSWLGQNRRHKSSRNEMRYPPRPGLIL